jgi:hypothetical protein
LLLFIFLYSSLRTKSDSLLFLQLLSYNQYYYVFSIVFTYCILDLHLHFPHFNHIFFNFIYTTVPSALSFICMYPLDMLTCWLKPTLYSYIFCYCIGAVFQLLTLSLKICYHLKLTNMLIISTHDSLLVSIGYLSIAAFLTSSHPHCC